MFSDRSLFSKINKSSSRLIKIENRINDDEITTNKNTAFNFDNEEKKEGLNFSKSFSQGDPDDFGLFTLNHFEYRDKEKEDYNPQKSEFFNSIKKFINKNNKFSLKNFNLIKHLNEPIYNSITGESSRSVSSKKMLIAHFAREENDYRLLRLPYQNNVDRTYEEDIINTNNSFILRMQAIDLKKNSIEMAIKRNSEYMNKKEYYEIELLLGLVDRLDESNKPGSKINISEPKIFEDLKTNSVKLRNNYSSQKSDKSKIKEFKIQSIDNLTKFIHAISQSVDDTPRANGPTDAKKGSKLKNFVIWKKKLSELVNIWELCDSSGLELKFPIKYLVLRKFFSDRALKRQTNIDSRKVVEEKIDIIQIIINLLCGITENKGVPKSIFMPTELASILLNCIMFFLLIYNLITIPIIEFLEYKTKYMLFVEKFVEMIFFMEVVFNFRKVYKDKSNNYVYDINKIFSDYISGYFFMDFLASIPWHFFVLGFSKSIYTSVKKPFLVLKLFRISKVGPILAKLEELSIGNYVKLLELVFIFFLFAHWLGCIGYSSIETSFDYGNLIDSCYELNDNKIKENMTFICKYLFSFYQTSYIIPGQYTGSMKVYDNINPTSEYLILIFFYMIGQALSAYIFGGMAAIIQNLNQGQNFFQNKIDMLNSHMLFYDVNQETMIDVKIYFDYMWQRHKDVIYGKSHFDQLSRSLREKFERLNLPGFEYLLAKFINLNPGNSKLIGNILMNLEKVILFPYELLFSEGSVSKGIFVLLNGDVILNSNTGANVSSVNQLINYSDIISYSLEIKKKNQLKGTELDEKFSFIFPLISAFIKTGRNYHNCYSENFTDLLFLPMNSFDQLIWSFPIEMHLMKHTLMDYVSEKKMFDDPTFFKLISRHSSRSTSKYYDKEYDKFSIWIPIPIPISQRKIAKNYINSFIKKIRNQWREILVMGDLNMCLNSYSVLNILKSKKENEIEKVGVVNISDPLENIKNMSKYIEKVTEKYLFDNFS